MDFQYFDTSLMPLSPPFFDVNFDVNPKFSPWEANTPPASIVCSDFRRMSEADLALRKVIQIFL